MKAKKKKIETFKPEDLGLDFVCPLSFLLMYHHIPKHDHE